jgi:hypothetical protein
MEMLALKDEDDFKSLKPNKWQIREFEHKVLGERENGEQISNHASIMAYPLTRPRRRFTLQQLSIKKRDKAWT